MGALVSNTCFAGIRKVTSCGEEFNNSCLQLGENVLDSLECWLNVWCLCCCGHSHRASGVFISKKSRHILETHWLGFSMSIVIFARGHGSGSVDRLCNNSDVSSGAITGSSPSFGRYCMAAAALPLLRCVWILAASCADWMRGPCWWTMALRYLHAQMAALRVLGPSSAWFLAAVARMSRASSSGDRGSSVLAVLCAGLQHHILVLLWCLVGRRG